MAKTLNVIHVSQNSNGYECVKLVANRVNQKNHLLVIEKDGELHYSGGFIFPDTPQLRQLFDTSPKSEHYALASLLKVDPFVKPYLEE